MQLQTLSHSSIIHYILLHNLTSYELQDFDHLDTMRDFGHETNITVNYRLNLLSCLELIYKMSYSTSYACRNFHFEFDICLCFISLAYNNYQYFLFKILASNNRHMQCNITYSSIEIFMCSVVVTFS